LSSENEPSSEEIKSAYSGLIPTTFLINKDTLINAVTIEYKSIFDFNIKLQTLQNFIEGTDVSARLLGSDLAQVLELVHYKHF
jgi:hypothetical protein